MKGMLAAILALMVVSGDTLGEPLTIEQAVDPRGTREVSLSPDGKHLVSVIFNGTNFGLLLHDTDTMAVRMLSTGKRVTEGFWTFNKMPRKVTWVGNDLIAVDYGIEAESINLAGKKVAELGEQVIGPAERGNPYSPNLLVYSNVEDGDVELVNARTGDSRRLKHPGGKVIKWAFDRRGELRAVTVVNSAFWKDVSTITNWYKSSGKADWEKLGEFKVTDDYWVPMYVPDEPDTLVISARHERDTYAIFSYDTKRHAIGEMMAGHPTQDILNVGGIDQSSFERVTTGGMTPQQIWFDAAWGRVQHVVDLALPNRINQISGNPKGKVLVFSYGDIDPGCWYLLDLESNSLQLVAKARPEVSASSLRPMQMLTYAAPDGVTVPAFLTRPDDKTQPVPLVVLIHGGPTARDYWAWNAEVQLLAANGYAVFQPQFRGSSGFGRRFEEAGFGQWGMAMQDDITAGVQYLIKQGVVDPKRICIAGTSYGGYAALWGLAKTPDMYRCGVSFAGVSDIEYMFKDSSDTAGDKVSRELMLSRIGDARLNKEQFDQVSPLKHADRISAPVLLIHGERDVRVPMAHGEKMKRALEKQGKKVEWLTFEREGHGLYYVSSQVTYYETLLQFLDRYIGVDIPPSQE